MKLRIDLEACSGHGLCYSLSPELFDADYHGHAVLLQEDVPEELAETARLAVTYCPERAISLET
jgi:ferredoxin